MIYTRLTQTMVIPLESSKNKSILYSVTTSSSFRIGYRMSNYQWLNKVRSLFLKNRAQVI